MTELNDPTLSALRKRIMLDDTLWENGLPRGEAINTIVAMIDDADAALVRPETVVTPLPTEAVREALATAMAWHRPIADGRGEVRSCSCGVQFGVQHQQNGTHESHQLDVLADSLPPRRFAPAADQRARDEGTVRVPQGAVDLLRVGMSEKGSTTDLHVAAGVILRAVDGSR